MNISPLRDMIQVDETWRPTRGINHFSICFTHSYLNYLSHICMRSTPNSPRYSAAAPDSLCSIYHQKPGTKLPNVPLQTAINSRIRLGVRAKRIVMAGILLMFHLQGWSRDGYSPLMPAADKSDEPRSPARPPPCQGHTHHGFTGPSAQVMHGPYSQSVSHRIYNKLRRQKPTHHHWDDRILGLLART